MRVEREQLEHKRDIALTPAQIGDVLTIQQNSAIADGLQAGDHAQRSGFTAAGRAKQHHKLAILDCQIDRLDRVEITKLLFNLTKLDCCHSCVLCPLSVVCCQFRSTDDGQRTTDISQSALRLKIVNRITPSRMTSKL